MIRIGGMHFGAPMLPSTVFAFLFILAVAMILDAAILRLWRQRQSPPATSRYVERARIWLNKSSSSSPQAIYL